ncbi:aldehyde dehydrogenase family protein [Herbiconiux sp. L3-i23]|uniref:aldehyde dehydrogenase family protein n=1 Tax=Herbiconiux sp. L3-i23 TaxID=2905871 RepID=UPI002066D5DD|nr:aldehyde dehydrogenase family protein [Herbiconiux sp. L3-i23]BDI23500.1 dehydrogenase [Herbiconiux sp. L3-i23]
MVNTIDGDKADLYIDGRWVSTGDRSERRSPSDRDDVIGRFAMAEAAHLDEAVSAAHAAAPGWRTASPQRRADLLEGVAATIAAEADRLATLLAREEGKAIGDARAEVIRASQLFRFFSGEALRVTGDLQDSVRPGVEVGTRYEPVGVVGIISPWNFPIAIPTWKAAPALAFGNTVVLKPAEIVSGMALALAEILDRVGFPPGVFNVVTGSGSVVGDALVKHPGIDAVTFTGSQVVGRRVAQGATDRLARVQLEMGGKNALVVLADADLDIAVDCAVNGAYYQTGQRCTASSRIVVEDAVHDEFVARMAEAMRREVVGNALDTATTIGPVVSQSQLDIDLGYLDLARGSAGVEVIGGELLERPTDGHFLSPALVVGGDAQAAFNREEIFGPVAGVIRVGDYEEALAVTNDSEFGLVSGICTTSLSHATDFQRRADTGMVMVNLPTAGVDPHVSFGGRKGSSFGPREQGTAARQFFTQIKTSYVRP